MFLTKTVAANSLVRYLPWYHVWITIGTKFHWSCAFRIGTTTHIEISLLSRVMCFSFCILTTTRHKLLMNVVFTMQLSQWLRLLLLDLRVNIGLMLLLNRFLSFLGLKLKNLLGADFLCLQQKINCNFYIRVKIILTFVILKEFIVSFVFCWETFFYFFYLFQVWGQIFTPFIFYVSFSCFIN
jgi:hypothetical protein